MKNVIALTLLSFAFITSSFATSIVELPPSYETEAAIVDVGMDQQTFPTAKGWVRYMPQCGDNFVRVEQERDNTPNEQGVWRVYVRVIVERNDYVMCSRIAPARPVTETFEVNTMHGPVELVPADKVEGEQVVWSCDVDGRPADGAYRSLSLKRKENGKYDVIYFSVSARLYPLEERVQSQEREIGIPGRPVPFPSGEIVLASDLNCRFSKKNHLISSCNKSGGMERNSMASSSRVREERVNNWNGKDWVRETYSFEISSPDTYENRNNPLYPSDIDAMGWVRMKFPISKCR